MNQTTISETNISKTKPTKKRMVIILLVCIITVINYLDRANMSVCAPFISKDFGLNAIKMGLVFSAMSWSYTCMQIPSGWLLDRFGSRMVYGMALCGWSIVTMLFSFASGLSSLIGLRLTLGIFEAPAFPANSRIVNTWFPAKERGLACGAYIAAEYIGLAFFTPVLTWIIASFGWRTVFIVTGLAGVLCVFVWLGAYRDPAKYKGVNQAELDLIRDGGGISDSLVEKEKFTWKEIKYLLKSRQLWGMYIGGFSITVILYFFMTWFPSYLVSAKHMTILKVGFYAVAPYLAAICGVLVAGKWSDWMFSKKYGVSMSRKLPIIVGLLLASTIIGANYTNNINIVISFMSIASFGQGMASAISWALLSEIMPKEFMGLCGSTFNFFGNMGGVLCPLIIGLLISATGSYASALVFVSAFGIIGTLSFIFLVGKPTRIVMPD